uniref:Uncharacterized protein n=1 Tax=Siphoviridae sp. ctEJG5 TaxID=2827814 RepID=A0A8S5RX55_9CAUD|nr:MAG TPA: hypothetical protein [Siphoviridae sp. ctEJG5]
MYLYILINSESRRGLKDVIIRYCIELINRGLYI